MNEIKVNLSHLMDNRDRLSEEDFSQLFSEIMSSYPYIGWELGCTPTEPFSDVLSLTVVSDEKEFKHLYDILALPINGDDWDIVAGIPPRNWDLYFQLMNEGEYIDVEASKWYWDANWKEDSVSLVIYVPEGELHKKNILKDAVDIAIVGELGELNIAKYVDDICIEHLTNNILKNKYKMDKLKGVFAQNYNNCHYAKFLNL